MTTRATLVIGGVLTLAALAYTLALYPSLPERIPIHWDINGRIDGWVTSAGPPSSGRWLCCPSCC